MLFGSLIPTFCTMFLNLFFIFALVTLYKYLSNGIFINVIIPTKSRSDLIFHCLFYQHNFPAFFNICMLVTMYWITDSCLRPRQRRAHFAHGHRSHNSHLDSSLVFACFPRPYNGLAIQLISGSGVAVNFISLFFPGG